MNNGKKSLLFLVGTGLQQVSTFIIIAYLSRKLTPSEYATYWQGDLIVKTLLPFLIIGIPLSLSYFLPKLISKKEQKQYIFQAIITLAVVGFIGCLLMILFSDFISKQYQNGMLSELIPLFAFYLFFEAITSFMPNYYLGTSQNKELVLYSCLYALMRMGSILIVYKLYKSINTIVIVILIMSILKFLYSGYTIFKRYKHIPLQINITSLSTMFFYAIPIGASQLIGKISDVLDKNMVSLMFTPEQYAIFANGSIEVPFVGLIGGSIAAVLLAEFSKNTCPNNDKDKIMMNQWRESITYTSMIIIPLMFLLLLYSDGFIELLFSVKYLNSSTIFRIYLLKMPVGIATYSTILLATKRNKVILYNSIICIGVNFILNIIFINLYSMEGAAIATVLSMYILAGLQVYQISKVMKIKVKEVLPLKNIALSIVISFSISCIFVLAFNAISINNVLKLITLGIPFFGVNIFTYHLFKVIDLKKLYNLIFIKKQRKAN